MKIPTEKLLDRNIEQLREKKERDEMSENNNLSVRRVLRVLTTPICNCGKCGAVSSDSPLTPMIKAGLYMELDGNDVSIELTAHTLKALRDQMPGTNNLTGGKGPFFQRQGKPPSIKHVVSVPASQVLEILMENQKNIDLTVVQRSINAIAMAG